MKKGITLGLVLCLCMIMLAGCGEEKKDKNPLAVYKNGKEVVSVGMTLEEAEKKLGKRIELKQNNTEHKTCVYEGIEVIYNNDTISNIILNNSTYSDCRGVKVGTPTEDLSKYYTEDEILMTNDVNRSPCYVDVSKERKIIEWKNNQAVNHIAIALSEDDKVKLIKIY